MLLLAFIAGMTIPGILLVYMSFELFEPPLWMITPTSYYSVIMSLLLYGGLGFVFRFVLLGKSGMWWDESFMKKVAIIVISLPIVLLFAIGYLYSDRTPTEQVTRTFVIWNPLLSTCIGFWIGGLLTSS